MSISLEQVSKHYDGAAAVNDVSVDIAEGELFVLLGPSGSGKSTLLRAIAGLTSIGHGRIMLRGRDVTHVSAREREVGFVFQSYALFRHMTVADNIEFALRARRVPAAERRRRRTELLELVSLQGFESRLPVELSGGQQQRVAVARALAHEPRVLLLDEPFGALDAKIRDELRRAIRTIQRAVGITTVLVTHDQEEAFTMADRIGVMDRGRLQEVGEPRTLYAWPRTRFVATFLGAANLLLGCYEDEGVRVGDSVLAVDRWPHGARSGDEATVVVRPEDIVLARREARLQAEALGDGTIDEVEFVGGAERIRLSIGADEGLASALALAAGEARIEAWRSSGAPDTPALSAGDRVKIGVRRLHVLSTPISSLRLITRGESDATRLARSPIVRELADSMHIVPTPYAGEDLPGASAIPGLAVLALEPRRSLEPGVALLEAGARQVLAVADADQRIERMLIYVQPSRPARDGGLSVAGSLLRHLPIDATLLVRAEERSLYGASYRQLLDLRSSALRVHGVDVRTETFRGGVGGAMGERLQSSEAQTLIVMGLTSVASGRAILDEVSALLAMHPRAAAVLLVNNRNQIDRPVERAAQALTAVGAL